MFRAGSCQDKTVAESWFATLKTELVYRIALTSKAFTRRRVIEWIDRYNRTLKLTLLGPLNAEDPPLHKPFNTLAG